MAIVDSDQAAIPHVEGVLREELVRGDKVLGGITPVLSHLLATPGASLVSEAIVARLRGMLSYISRQILIAADGSKGFAAPDPSTIDRFAEHLAQDSAILSHLYATAMEGYFAQRLEARQSIDPVLGPLMQELIASDEPAVAELAMAAMAAQSRFIQSQRRMEHPLTELPAELFLLVIRRSVAYVRDNVPNGSPSAVQSLKRNYDESTTRTGLFGRLVMRMACGARAALEIDHAGLALFASALSHLARQPRELAVLACHERQGARLALSLRAAGLDTVQIARQFAQLGLGERLPGGLDDMAPERAAAILGHSPARGGV
jgi:hypothetical protein